MFGMFSDSRGEVPRLTILSVDKEEGEEDLHLKLVLCSKLYFVFVLFCSVLVCLCKTCSC